MRSFFTCETSEKIHKLTFKCFNRIFLYDKTKRLGSSVEKIQKSSTEQEMGIRSIWEKHTTQFNWRFHNELSWNFVAINAFSKKNLGKKLHITFYLYTVHIYRLRKCCTTVSFKNMIYIFCYFERKISVIIFNYIFTNEARDSIVHRILPKMHFKEFWNIKNISV